MKYKFLFLSLFSLLILFVLTIIKVREIDDYRFENVKCDSYLLSHLRENISKQLQSNNCCIDAGINLLDQSGEVIHFCDIIKETKFVIRFRGTQCRSCINIFNQYLERLQKVVSDIGNDSVIILLDSKNIEDLQVIADKMNCEVYSVSTGDLPLELDNEVYIIPFYFFTLSHFLMVQDCFIPVDNLNELLDVYVESIKRKYHV